MDKLKEFIDEISWRWDDPYFWADHQALSCFIAIVILYAVTLVFDTIGILLRIKLEQMGDVTHA